MKLENKRVIVTGGAGFIGSHVVDVLVEQENQVVVIDDFSVGSIGNLSRHEGSDAVIVHTADICDRDAMDELVTDADLVLHMAVACLRTSLNEPVAVHEVNATGTLNVCLAAARNDVGRLVYVSSSEAYGSAQFVPMDENHPQDPTTVYGATKLVGEGYALAMMHTYGLETTVIRPFNSYGPREHHTGKRAEVIPKFVLRTMAGGRPVIFGDGSQTRDFTWVPDTARGIVAVCESDKLVGERVNVARGQEVSIARIARLVLDALGLPDDQPEFSDPRPGDVDRHYADTTKVEGSTGWSSLVSIEDGLRRYIEWVKCQEIDPAAWLEAEQLRNW